MYFEEGDKVSFSIRPRIGKKTNVRIFFPKLPLSPNDFKKLKEARETIQNKNGL